MDTEKIDKVKFHVENKEQFNSLMKRLEELGHVWDGTKKYPTHVDYLKFIKYVFLWKTIPKRKARITRMPTDVHPGFTLLTISHLYPKMPKYWCVEVHSNEEFHTVRESLGNLRTPSHRRMNPFPKYNKFYIGYRNPDRGFYNNSYSPEWHGELITFEQFKTKHIKTRKQENMKDMKLKFNVENSPELSAAIQSRLFELGASWIDDNKTVQYTNKPYLFVDSGYVTFGEIGWTFKDYNNKETILDDLYKIPTKHTFTFSNGIVVKYDKEKVSGTVSEETLNISRDLLLKIIPARGDIETNRNTYEIIYPSIKIGYEEFKTEEVKELYKAMINL